MKIVTDKKEPALESGGHQARHYNSTRAKFLRIWIWGWRFLLVGVLLFLLVCLILGMITPIH